MLLTSFDAVAWQVGELCGRTKTTDVCDAHVAVVASRYAHTVYTSDPGDISRLLSKLGRRAPVVVRC